MHLRREGAVINGCIKSGGCAAAAGPSRHGAGGVFKVPRLGLCVKSHGYRRFLRGALGRYTSLRRDTQNAPSNPLGARLTLLTPHSGVRVDRNSYRIPNCPQHKPPEGSPDSQQWRRASSFFRPVQEGGYAAAASIASASPAHPGRWSRSLFGSTSRPLDAARRLRPLPAVGVAPSPVGPSRPPRRARKRARSRWSLRRARLQLEPDFVDARATHATAATD
jgi:hypothetical protein